MNPGEVQLTTDAVMALENGKVIEAIKLVRESTGLGLKESKDAVDRYLASRPELQERVRASGADGSRVAVLALALMLLAGAVIAFLLSRRA